MDIQTHPIQPDDYADVADMLKQLYLELGEAAESVANANAALVGKMVAKGVTQIFKAVVANGDIVGVLTLTESQAIYAGGAYGLIDELYVSPNFRSQQVGRMLIEDAVRIGRQKGWLRISVTAPTDNNSRPVAFYEANGFEFSGPKLKRVI